MYIIIDISHKISPDFTHPNVVFSKNSPNILEPHVCLYAELTKATDLKNGPDHGMFWRVCHWVMPWKTMENDGKR